MKKRTLVFGVAAVLAAAVAVVVTRGGFWFSPGAVAQAPRQNAPRVVSVEVAIAEKRKVPVRVEALGTVTPIASVAVKTRVDSEVVKVHFQDGARVKAGDVLFTLDSRTIEAQIKQVQGLLDGAKAQLEQAERDVARYTDLLAKNATTQVTLNNARTQMTIWRAAVDSNTGQLENLRIQLSYCTIRAPIAGRASSAMVKVGNQVRQADIAPLATINQIAPIYVSFTIPQRSLADVRQAVAAETATLEAIVPGTGQRATGQVSMIENTVDLATGMVIIRATMPNTDELLWPGTLVNTELTLRIVEGVTIPASAVQVSQTGTFVFVVKDNVASVRPVKIARTVDGQSVVESGISEGEMVVTDGQLLLSNGTKVTQRKKVSS